MSATATATVEPPAVMARISATLRAATARLASSSSPRLDSELLLAAILGCSRVHLITHADDDLSREQLQAFDDAIDRRADAEPVAYLIGEKEFWGLPLRVTPAVLVPRPETELLVEWALELLEGQLAPSIADLGTGSGAIALALAHVRPDARLVAVDASDQALGVARANAEALGLKKVEFRSGDWLAPLASERFDLIVSNPPYIAVNDPHLQALRHEPRVALVAGDDGLAAIRSIVGSAQPHLQPGAWLLLEHGADQAGAVRVMLNRAGCSAVETRCDLAGLERATGGRWT